VVHAGLAFSAHPLGCYDELHPRLRGANPLISGLARHPPALAWKPAQRKQRINPVRLPPVGLSATGSSRRASGKPRAASSNQ
jgi:hypothetical protein